MSSNCNPLICIPKPCFDSNVGSFDKLYLLDIDDVNFNSISMTHSHITGATFSEDFVEFSFPKNSGVANETKNVEIATGAGIYEQTVTITIPYRQVTTRNAIQLAGSGNRDLWVVIKDGNGIYWVYGYARGMNLTTVDSQSGENAMGGSRYILTFTGQEGALPYTIDGSLIETDCA